MWVLLLLCLAVLSVATAQGRHRAIERQHASEEELLAITDMYWAYEVADHVGNASSSDTEPSSLLPGHRLGYSFVLPLPERLSGITYVGHAARLRMLLERVRQGEAIRVAALGGSITAGHGTGGRTYGDHFTKWLNSAMPPIKPLQPAADQEQPAAPDGELPAAPGEGLPAVEDGALPSATEGGLPATPSAVLLLPAASARTPALPAGPPGAADGGSGKRRALQGETAATASAHAAAAAAAAAARARGYGLPQDGENPYGSLLGGQGQQQQQEEQGQQQQQEEQGQQRQQRQLQDGGPGARAGGSGRGTQRRRAFADAYMASAEVVGAEAAMEADLHAGWGETGVPRHEYVNGAVPGTGSGYMLGCLEHHLPPQTDLVLVEYAVNDSPTPSAAFEDPDRRAIERLLRTLLLLPSRPAVILVNMFAYNAAGGRYLHNAERDFSELATYYGVPSVSLKAAVMPTIALANAHELADGPTSSSTSSSSAESAPPSASSSATVPELARAAIFNGGLHHPGRGGHVVTAELLITLAQDLLIADERLAASLAAPSSVDGGAGWNASSGAGGDEGGASGGGPGLPGAVRLLARVAHRPLPPPLCEGNFETASPTCYIEQELQALVRQPVVGWNWTDEGRGKWGWVALEEWHQLRIQVNTQWGGKPPAEGSPQQVVVQLAYLQSYERMGVVAVSCESGCSCEETEVDGFAERKVSVTYMRDLAVSQHPQCVLLLVTIGPGRDRPRRAARKAADDEEDGVSRGAKFKVMGLVVAQRPARRRLGGAARGLRDVQGL